MIPEELNEDDEIAARLIDTCEPTEPCVADGVRLFRAHLNPCGAVGTWNDERNTIASILMETCEQEGRLNQKTGIELYANALRSNWLTELKGVR